MSKIIKLIATENNKNKRIDSFISQQETKISRTKIKNLIIDGNLKINNDINLNPDKKIKIDDIIELKIPDLKKTHIKPLKYKLNIVFEDKDILVINKPANLTVHPGAGNYENTLVNALVYYCKKNLSTINRDLRPGIIHRLDKDTSGLLVVAKNNQSHINLSKQFSDHIIDRTYVALVWGKIKPKIGRIKTLITRSNKNRQHMEVSFKKGKEAITNYKTLEVFENNKVPTLSLIELKLETGRTHQIRVHMSYKGNQILGDKKYKKKYKKLKNINNDLNIFIKNIKRQFLHAKSLGFFHPLNNKKMFFTSELPLDLNKILKKLRFLSNK